MRAAEDHAPVAYAASLLAAQPLAEALHGAQGEMEGGPEVWEQAMAGEDRIHLTYLNVSIKEIE